MIQLSICSQFIFENVVFLFDCFNSIILLFNELIISGFLIMIFHQFEHIIWLRLHLFITNYVMPFFNRDTLPNLFWCHRCKSLVPGNSDVNFIVFSESANNSSRVITCYHLLRTLITHRWSHMDAEFADAMGV